MATTKTIYNSSTIDCVLELLWQTRGIQFDRDFVDIELTGVESNDLTTNPKFIQDLNWVKQGIVQHVPHSTFVGEYILKNAGALSYISQPLLTFRPDEKIIVRADITSVTGTPLPSTLQVRIGTSPGSGNVLIQNYGPNPKRTGLWEFEINAPPAGAWLSLVNVTTGCNYGIQYLTVKSKFNPQQGKLIITARDKAADGRPGIYSGTAEFIYQKCWLDPELPTNSFVYGGSYPTTFGQLRSYLQATQDFYMEESDFTESRYDGLLAGILTDSSIVNGDLWPDGTISLSATERSGRWTAGSTIRIIPVSKLLENPAPPLVLSGTSVEGHALDYYQQDYPISGGGPHYENARVVDGVLPAWAQISVVGQAVRIKGLPMTAGEFSFMIAVDSGMELIRQTARLPVTIKINEPAFEYASRLLFDRPDGSTEIVDEGGHAWTIYGAAKIRNDPRMPNGKSLYFTSNTNDYLSTDDPSIDLSTGAFCLEGFFEIDSPATENYEASLLQYGFGLEGATGFHVGVLTSGATHRVVLRNSASNAVIATDRDFRFMTRQHIAIVHNGVDKMWVCLQGQAWSSPLPVPIADIHPNLLYVHHFNGSWKQHKYFRVGDLITTLGSMKYTPGVVFTPPGGIDEETPPW